MSTLTSDDIIRKIKLLKLLELNVLQSYNLTDSVRTATHTLIDTTTHMLVDNTSELISEQIILKTFDLDSMAHNLCVQFYNDNKQLYTFVIERTFGNLINCCKVSYDDVLLEFTRFEQMDINFHNFRTFIQTIKLIPDQDPDEVASFMKWRLNNLKESYDDCLQKDNEEIFVALTNDIANYGHKIDNDEKVSIFPKSKFFKLLGLLAFLPISNPSMPTSTAVSTYQHQQHQPRQPVLQDFGKVDIPETAHLKKNKKNEESEI